MRTFCSNLTDASTKPGGTTRRGLDTLLVILYSRPGVRQPSSARKLRRNCRLQEQGHRNDELSCGSGAHVEHSCVDVGEGTVGNCRRVRLKCLTRKRSDRIIQRATTRVRGHSKACACKVRRHRQEPAGIPNLPVRLSAAQWPAAYQAVLPSASCARVFVAPRSTQFGDLSVKKLVATSSLDSRFSSPDRSCPRAIEGDRARAALPTCVRRSARALGRRLLPVADEKH